MKHAVKTLEDATAKKIKRALKPLLAQMDSDSSQSSPTESEDTDNQVDAEVAG